MPSIDTALSQETIMRDSRGRISQFSYIRVVACAAIVLLHTVNSARVYHSDTISAGDALSAYVICSMLMWAVPCFLMVTGALLLDPAKEIPRSKLFGKYIRRMIVALVIFTAIFTLIRHDASSGTGILAEFLNGLAFNHCMAYLWYLYLMIATYLMMPLLKKAADSLSAPQLWAVSIALIVISIMLQVLLRNAGGWTAAVMGIGSTLQLLTCCTAYVFMGRLLFLKRPGPVISFAVFAASTVILAVATHITGRAVSDPSYISAYCSPLVVLQAGSIYSLMLGIKKEAGAFIRSADNCSFGIYLIHMIFVRLTMSEMGVDPYSFGPLGFILLSAIFFFAAYGTTWLIKKFTGSMIV